MVGRVRSAWEQHRGRCGVVVCLAVGVLTVSYVCMSSVVALE